MYNHDDRDFLDQMAATYPALMEKSNIDAFYIEEGWYGIIDAMFNVICHNYSRAENIYRGAILYPRDTNGEWLAECEARLNEEKEKLPVITQIKEKYAELVVYSKDPMDERTKAAVNFAEILSNSICEKCGNKGFHGGIYPEKTYCRIHHQEAGNELLD